MAYTAPGLLALDGTKLSQGGRRIFAQELDGLIGSALNYMLVYVRERNNFRLTPGKLWDEMQS